MQKKRMTELGLLDSNCNVTQCQIDNGRPE